MAGNTNFVTALPGSPDPSSLYFVGNGTDNAQFYVTTSTGVAIPVATDEIIQALAQTEAQNAVDAIVGSAPGTLDTLEELSTALNDNPDIITNLVTSVGQKADASNVYTKSESDSTEANLVTSIGLKADASDVYTKSESDTRELNLQTSIDQKADASDVYTKSESDSTELNLQLAIDLKADASDVYTRTESDNALGLKQDSLSNAADLANYGDGTYNGASILTVGTVEW